MRSVSKTGLVIIGFVAAALLVGAGMGMLMGRQNLPKPAIDVPLPLAAPATNVTAASNHVAPAAAAAQTNEDKADSQEDLPANATVSQKLDAIILSDADPSVKADRILALMPQADAEKKVELAQHLVNLVMDDHYAATGELLTDPTTPSDVSSVLLNDLLNRNNKIKLPMLLAVARVDNHPLKTEAHDMLELLVQEDKGTNWADWEKTVDKWLKDNEPDEPPFEAPQGN